MDTKKRRNPPRATKLPRVRQGEPVLPPSATGFPFVAAAPELPPKMEPSVFQNLEEMRRQGQENARRAEQERIREEAQIRVQAEAAEKQRIAEESIKAFETLVQQKRAEQLKQKEAEDEAKRVKEEAEQKERNEIQTEQIKVAQQAVTNKQCPFGDLSNPCPKGDDKLAQCVDILCKNLGKVDESGLLCQDPYIKDAIQRELFAKFGITDTSWDNLATAMNTCTRANRITVMENFIATLFSYLKTLQRGGDDKNKASPRKIAALEKFINSLHERLEMEDKLGCAGDKCGEPDDPNKFLRFNEIAGATKEKNQIKKSFILPAKYPGLFPDFAKGILFFGPPGTGKTLLAQAAAKEIPNAAFFAPTPADLKGGVVGETEKKIKNVFECACERISNDPKYKQAVLFFDEFESVAAQRGGSGAGVSSSALTVPTLLQYLEGSAAKRVEKGGPISVMAATNLPWCLDGAIIRRFPIQIMVDLPDADAREFIIRDKLNRAFSKFIPEKDYEKYGIEENPEKGKFEFHVTSNENAKFQNRAYTDKNFRIRVSGDERTVNRNSGGIYKEMLDVFLQKNFETNVDQMVNFIVKLTGPDTSEEAYKYRRFNDVDREKEHSDMATTKYGFSASDVAKAMDNIISNTGQRALNNIADPAWAIYDLSKTSQIPTYVKENYIVVAKTPFDDGIMLAKTQYVSSKIITWDIDIEKEIGFVKKVTGKVYNTPATVIPGANNPLKKFGTINEKQYEQIVYYNDTKQIPKDENGVEVKC
jgi:SpoVK/Ycf46/Vps4 family AAA+-type ATPase